MVFSRKLITRIDNYLLVDYPLHRSSRDSLLFAAAAAAAAAISHQRRPAVGP